MSSTISDKFCYMHVRYIPWFWIFLLRLFFYDYEAMEEVDEW